MNRQVITHRLDPDLLYRIDYFLMLYARSLGAEVTTEALAAASAAASAAIAGAEKAIDEGQPAS